jgi:hypothetical protein
MVAYATYKLTLIPLSILSLTGMVMGKLHPFLSLYMSPSRMRINVTRVRLYVGPHTGVSCFKSDHNEEHPGLAAEIPTF